MFIAVMSGEHGAGWLQALSPNGEPLAPSTHAVDLARTIADMPGDPRWVLADIAETYPYLLRHGTRLAQCHDITLTDKLLRVRTGETEGPHGLDAAYARLCGHGISVTVAPPPQQETLFDTAARPDPRAQLDQLVDVFADQRRQLHTPSAIGLLAAADSAGALIAAEMTHHGLPWRSDVHDAILTDMLGPKPTHGSRPRVLQRLVNTVSESFGRPVNPDSPQQLLQAFAQAGHPLESTRARVLERVDHPAVPPLLEYKELSRVHVAHGWSWMRQWVGDGPGGLASTAKRFRPRYVVAGVPTGRWATDGGAALQIPKTLRAAVRADPGHRLVIADAAQLEPRMLAAMSGDPGMIAATESDDMYAALAPTFGGSRADAKIALLSAMYGGTAGNATALSHTLRRRFRLAYDHVEEAARAGEKGKVVHSWLGRACPPAPERWWRELTGPNGTRAARERGRFTRNFIVQGTAAEWALAMMALLRQHLYEAALGNLVFFQHDEIIVHCLAGAAESVARHIQQCSDAAMRLLFGDTPVKVPLHAKTVSSYADAKD